MTAAEFRIARPIALVGLMGAGKTTVGARLAARLGLPFVDSDAAIEQAEGASVAELFDQRGEPAFRKVERETVVGLLSAPAGVIAAGGGAFADEATRRRLLARCTVIWLDADVRILAARVAGDDGRPLLRGRDPEAVLADLAGQRNAFFAQAPIRIDAEPPVEQVVESLVAAITTRD